MQKPGLYYPFIHVRDDDWLKVAALYWPSIRRLVPDGYVKRDSSTARTLVDAQLLKDEDPGHLLIFAGLDLIDTLQRNADHLARQYSVERAAGKRGDSRWATAAGIHGQNPALAWIHLTKFPPHVVDHLCDMNLAIRGRSSDVGRHGESWIGLHPVLAGAYMTVLAARLSQSSHFEPLTDQHDLKVATPNNDVQAAVRLLLGRSAEAGGQARRAAADGTERYVMLALEHVRPTGIGDIPADKIVQLRDTLAEELVAFRDYVASQQAELAELAAIQNDARKLEAFAEHVKETIKTPLENLEKGLRLRKLEPTRSLLLTSTVAPPLAVGTTLDALAVTSPGVAAATGAVVAIGSAWWQVGSIRAQARRDSPVGYLLDVRDHLTPRTVVARARKVLRGTYGR